MLALNNVCDCLKVRLFRLEDKVIFLSGFDRPFPAINACYRRGNLSAGCQPRFDQCSANALSDRFVRTGGYDLDMFHLK